MGILVQDQYTDPDSTLLSSHTPAPINGQSLSYSQPTGGYQILSDHAQEASTNAATQTAVLQAGVGDCTISLDVLVQDGNVTRTDGTVSFRTNAGICFRLSDASNYWQLLVLNTTHNESNAYQIVLYKVVSGTPNLVATLESSLSLNNSTQTLKVVLSGSSITCYRNGSASGSPQTDTFNDTATEHGINSLYTGEADTLHNNYPWNVMDNLEIDISSSVEGACLII